MFVESESFSTLFCEIFSCECWMVGFLFFSAIFCVDQIYAPFQRQHLRVAGELCICIPFTVTGIGLDGNRNEENVKLIITGNVENIKKKNCS